MGGAAAVVAGVTAGAAASARHTACVPPTAPERAVPKLMPDDRRAERVVRCVFGLFLFGLGIALMLRADVGTAPWDVFHTGVADLLDVDVGPVIIATGVALLLL